MKERKPLRSEMGFSTPDKITVRGYDLPNQLLGKIDLGGMAFLEITGRMPNPREAEVFNALLVTLVEHGMTPQAIASRLISICSPEAMQASVAAGLLGVGNTFAGGSEQIARILQSALDGKDAGADLNAIAQDIVEDYATRKAPIPGIGHPLHKPIARARRCCSRSRRKMAIAATTSRCLRQSARRRRSASTVTCRSTPPARSARS
jgi:citrate synthase